MSVISSLQKLKVELKRVSGRSASSFVCGSTCCVHGPVRGSNGHLALGRRVRPPGDSAINSPKTQRLECKNGFRSTLWTSHSCPFSESQSSL
jgi:hypothetical protein